MRLLFISLAFLASATPSFASEFCEGFERGYKMAYKRLSGSAFEPFAPFCPFQPFKRFSDPESDFEHGVLIGYEKAVERLQDE